MKETHKKMHNVTVELKVLTPMFTYGEKNICEFRLTELKSLMRTIFREFFEFKNLEDMKEQEGKIFGNLGGKAPVSFRMVKIKDNNNENLNYNENSKYKKIVIIKHPLLPHRKEKKDQSDINSIKIDETISFKMISWDKEILDLYCQILLLSSVLGSIGKRARKGFGSFRIVNFIEATDTKYNEWLEKKPFKILEEIKKELKNDLKIREFKEENGVITFDKYEDKSLDFPYVKEIRIIELKKDIDDSLKNISQLTHDRMIFKNKDDSNSFIESITPKIKRIDREVLGSGKPRFASPVWISFYKYINQEYLIVKILNYNYMTYQNVNDNNKYIDAYIEDLEKIGGGTWQSYSQSQ